MSPRALELRALTARSVLFRPTMHARIFVVLAAVLLWSCAADPRPQTATTEQVLVEKLRITAARPPTAYAGTQYQIDADALGGHDPIAWSLSGSVPGLKLLVNNRRAILAGTPAAIGTYLVSLAAADADGTIVSAPLSIRVLALPPPPNLSAASLAPAQTGVFYSAPIAGGGGLEPLVWTSAGVPPGLAFDSATHLISGTPLLAGSFSILLRATDAAGRTASARFPIDIEVPLSVRAMAIPGVNRFTPYSVSFAASGGSAPYLWRIASGALPLGLSLREGTISGEAEVLGDFPLSLEVRDGLGFTATRALVLHVAEMVGPAADRAVALWPIPSPRRNASEFSVYTASVTDTITRISWERTPFVAATQADAAAHCASLAYGGRTDWRLPTFIEMISIQSSNDEYQLASVFDGITTELAWVASPIVWMEQGWSWNGDGSVYCARSNPVADRPHYTAIRGTSLDNFTGLMWFSTGSLQSYEAFGSCRDSTRAGFSDWRQPTFKELESVNLAGALGYSGWFASDWDDEIVLPLAREPSFSGHATPGEDEEYFYTLHPQACVREVSTGCAPVVADASLTPTTWPTGQVITLDAGASSTSGSCIPHYTWTLSGSPAIFMGGPGGRAVPVLPINPGTYALTLHATVDGQPPSTDTRTITVTAPAGCASLWLTLGGSSSGYTIVANATGGTPPYRYLFTEFPNYYVAERYGDSWGLGPDNTAYYSSWFYYHADWSVVVVDANGCTVEVDDFVENCT